jgi:hypothetical protein
MTTQQKKNDRKFFAGGLVALMEVKAHEHCNGSEMIFDAIVQAFGADHLLKEASRSGNMRSSGMSEWVRRQKQNGN